MPPSAWSDPDTEALLGLAVDLLAQGDARGATLLTAVLTRECGRDFAQTVATALGGGTPPAAFEFLPAPTGRLGTAAPARPAPVADAPRPRRAPLPLPTAGYVSAAEVAAHFGVSAKAVYRWMASGRIRAEKRPGGSYRIPAEQFHTG